VPADADSLPCDANANSVPGDGHVMPTDANEMLAHRWYTHGVPGSGHAVPTDANEVHNGNRWRDADSLPRCGYAVPTDRDEMCDGNWGCSNQMPGRSDSMPANANRLLARRWYTDGLPGG